ncbi:hypothetical protein [Agromyces sp. Marseille-Q5079]|uniref:hypothetical protein n=1 Tax=Agromyces sp. Marseille-Q5079 TaxID=3439059 RepID=UPI003D9C9D1B
MSDARETTGPTEPVTPTPPASSETVGLGPTGPGTTGSDDARATATTALIPPAAETPAYAGPAARTSPRASRPTVRWGALVWALIFASIAAVTLWLIVDAERRADADAWLADLNPFAAGLYALIVVGVVVALFGIVGLIRRGERARS